MRGEEGLGSQTGSGRGGKGGQYNGLQEDYSGFDQREKMAVNKGVKKPPYPEKKRGTKKMNS